MAFSKHQTTFSIAEQKVTAKVEKELLSPMLWSHLETSNMPTSSIEVVRLCLDTHYAHVGAVIWLNLQVFFVIS